MVMLLMVMLVDGGKSSLVQLLAQTLYVNWT
jgi:hypothetical protein